MGFLCLPQQRFIIEPRSPEVRYVHYQPRSGARSIQGEDPERESCTDAEADAGIAFKAASVGYLP